MKPPHLFRFFVVLLLTFTVTRAHDVLLAAVDAEAGETEVALTLTFARSVAAYLAGENSAPRARFRPEDFEPRRAAFEKSALTLCALEIAGEVVAPLRVTATLSGDEDIVYTLAYARPASPSSRLRLQCLWLARLPAAEGYAAFFLARGKTETFAGPVLLKKENPAIEFTLAAGSARPTPSTPSLTSPP